MIGNISGQKSLFGIALGSILDPNNRWVKLSNKMPWTKIEDKLSIYFCKDNGRPCLPICIASHDYELAGRLPLQRAREILTELKRQMAGEGERHG